MMTEEQQEMQHQLIRALDVAEAAGKPWVAFDDQPGKQLNPLDLHFFASAPEAEYFCQEANGPDNFVDQVFNSDHYIFLKAVSLAVHFGQTQQMIRFSKTAVARQMADQQLYLPSGHSFQDFEAALVEGLVYPLLWQRSVFPLKEIADYHVIAHQHCGGQFYENGHSHRVLETFGRYNEARGFMDNAVLFNELSDKGTDYLLAGRFHDQKLELDMEGNVLPHTGLTLLTAHHNYQHGHDYQELQSLFKPAVVSRYFFAGLKAGELHLYNDRPEQTIWPENQCAFYPEDFNNNYLTTKNSSIMNEQSFDYVKNQLFYLGFGEEIARPLRTKMEQNLTEFTLPHTRKFGQDETHSVLHFSKGDQKDKDMTFFNRADVTLKQPGKEDLTQTFFYGKEFNYTLQERYNMMDGRAAYREQPKVAPVEENGEVRMKPTGETYHAWRGLDFKNADKYGNFNPKVMFWNHQKEVSKYPIKGIEENYDKQRLIAKLEKGNKVDVILVRDGHEMPAKMVANPKMTRLDFYDTSGQFLIVRKIEKQAVDQTQKVEIAPQEVQKAAIARAAEQKQGEISATSQDTAKDKKQDQAQKAGVDGQNNNTTQRKKHGVNI